MHRRTNQSRALGVAILVLLVMAVIAFGRRHASEQPGVTDSDRVVLRHPYALNIDTTERPASYLRPASDRSDPAVLRSIQSPGSRPARDPLATVPNRHETARPSLQAVPGSRPGGRGFTTRTHRIVEGDSLEQLAAKYLGSADRYMELFEANRATLSRPDLLPLGKRILIPDATWPVRPVLHGPATPKGPIQPASHSGSLVPVPQRVP